MISDALSIVSWRSRPRSFVALMSLYESNYLRLAALAGDLRRLPDTRVSRVANDWDLRLNVTERSPYMVYGEVPLPNGRVQRMTEVAIPAPVPDE